MAKHPARCRPGMYTGPQGDRTTKQWLDDAVEAYENPTGIIIDMDTNRVFKSKKGI